MPLAFVKSLCGIMFAFVSRVSLAKFMFVFDSGVFGVNMGKLFVLSMENSHHLQ